MGAVFGINKFEQLCKFVNSGMQDLKVVLFLKPSRLISQINHVTALNICYLIITIPQIDLLDLVLKFSFDYKLVR